MISKEDRSGVLGYFDVPIIGHLFGPTLDFDSLSIFNATSCAVPSQYLSDTLILKMQDFEKMEDSNYPVFYFVECANNFVRYSNDSISYYAIREGSHMVRVPNSSSYKDFLIDYGKNCSESANPDDLDKLKGLEILGNPIQQTLYLRNNIDKEVKFSIFSGRGQSILNKIAAASTDTEVDFSNYPPGVYFIRAYDGIGVRFQKVIKL
jgi:hypothetical protein